MMADKQAGNKSLISKIAPLVIIILLVAFTAVYFTSPKPVFNLEDKNNNGFNKNSEDTITLDLNNKGTAPGFAILCYYSKEFAFKTDNGDFVHYSCFKETKDPIQSGSIKPYTLTVKPEEYIFYYLQNASIRVEVICNQKIWSLLPKKCDSVTQIYQYEKDGDRFNKIT
ncbi:MAG: hypothetical protein WAW23_04780 [Candidatus Methanoperedens sp.]